jgi:spore coat protein U-like protein
MTMTTRRIAVLIIAASVVAAVTARADSIGGRMDVSANVVANCRLIVPPLSFGTYDPLLTHAAQPSDASAVLTVTCTRNTGAALSFDAGQHGAVRGARSMSGPGVDGLHYDIYRDPAHSQSWGQGSDAVRLISKGINQPQQLTVFGRIPPQQEVEPGAYTDVLTAAVDF